MTIKSQIIALKKDGYSNRRIAEELGCRVEYVRTAWARRDGSRPSDKAAWRRQYPKVKAARMATYHAMPRAERAAIRKVAYENAVKKGASPQKAAVISARAVFDAAYKKYSDVYRQAYAQAEMEAAE